MKVLESVSNDPVFLERLHVLQEAAGCGVWRKPQVHCLLLVLAASGANLRSIVCFWSWRRLAQTSGPLFASGPGGVRLSL